MSMIETFYKVSGTIQHERDGETFDIDYVADIGPEDNCEPEIPDELDGDFDAIMEACYADAYRQLEAAGLDANPQPVDAPDRAGQEATATASEAGKATPRPWKAIDVLDARGNPVAWAVWPDLDRPYSNSPRGNQICRTPDGTTPQAKANAALIVRAVNSHDRLVEACKKVAHVLKTDSTGAIADTIWVSDFETAWECLDSALESAQ